MVTSANSIATSVIGFCRPVSTFASLIGMGSGNIVERKRTLRILSTVVAVLTRLLRLGGGGAVIV
ncbi:hypothetical protein GCM10027413_16090 [Conyzicola nivalis]|uniref:Uncharacterized protein n=1 Tax=Conyzicola nivalis TaxID=1477021 RepID=A0A916SGH8_9MICO|nr:hypothetical protein GCM10010979_10530 [Conyzicola nivalis]